MEIPAGFSDKTSEFLNVAVRSRSIPSRQFWVIGNELEEEVVRTVGKEFLLNALILGARGPIFIDFLQSKDSSSNSGSVVLDCSNRAKSFASLIASSRRRNLLVFSDWLAERHDMLPHVNEIVFTNKFQKVIFIEPHWFSARPKIFKNENDSYSRKDLYQKFISDFSNYYFLEVCDSNPHTRILMFKLG